MVYKALGSVFLCLCGGLSSIYISKFEKKRLSVLDSFISLIFYIKGQVDCYSMPLDEILGTAPPKLLESCSYACGEGLIYMVEKSRVFLSEESFRLIYCFSSEFGSTYREEQMKRCDYYIEALTREREILAGEIPKRSKIYSTLAICSSLCLAIMLW